MRINLISNDNYYKLLEIYRNNPNLTLQNKGYEYLKNLSDLDKTKIKEVETILKEAICGFHSFSNFRFSTPTDELQIRFQYNYNYEGGTPFSGVGYILLDELLNGFRD